MQLPEREAAAQLSQEVAEENMQSGGKAISARDLMDDDGPRSVLEETFKALHHLERKVAEKVLITDGQRSVKCGNMGT